MVSILSWLHWLYLILLVVEASIKKDHHQQRNALNRAKEMWFYYKEIERRALDIMIQLDLDEEMWNQWWIPTYHMLNLLIISSIGPVSQLSMYELLGIHNKITSLKSNDGWFKITTHMNMMRIRTKTILIVSKCFETMLEDEKNIKMNLYFITGIHKKRNGEIDVFFVWWMDGMHGWTWRFT